jgi:lipoate-protein ligase A
LVTDNVDPYWNLAFENYLLEEKRRTNNVGRWLFLWRNAPSVILGRNQNPWVECNIPWLKERNINLVRRQSGGGTVFHDLGNTCISIFTEKHEPEKNLQFACDSLRESFNLNAYIGPRKDIFVDEFKVSGSAFRITSKACYHHFTLLLSTDLETLGMSLKPTEVKLVSKGTASVRSKVLNLASKFPSIDHASVSLALSSKFNNTFSNSGTTSSPIITEFWDLERIKSVSEVQTTHAEYSSWPYIYGRTPDFTHHLTHAFGPLSLDMALNVSEGSITDVQIESNSNNFVIEAALKNALIGQPYHAETLSQTLQGQELFIHDQEDYIQFRQIRQWLESSVHS